MKNTFSTRLKILRKREGKTQEEIANMLGVKRATYGEYERGKITPSIEKLDQMAKILGTTPQYLIGWEGDTTEAEDRLRAMANFFNINVKQLNGLISAEGVDYESQITAIKRIDRWMDVTEGLKFTDEEMDELINYGKYLVSRRTKNDNK